MSRTYRLGGVFALAMLLVSGPVPVFAGGNHWRHKTTATVTYAPMATTTVGQMQYVPVQYAAPVQYQMAAPLTYSLTTTAAPTLGYYYVQAQAPATQPSSGALGSSAASTDPDTVMLRSNPTYIRLSARLGGEFNTRALVNELRSKLDQQVTTLTNAGSQATLKSINWTSFLTNVANVFFQTYFGTAIPSDITDLINTVIQDVINGKGLAPSGGVTPAPPFAPAPPVAPAPAPPPAPSTNIPAGQVTITISNAVLTGTISSASAASATPATPATPVAPNTNDGGQAAPKPTR